VTVSEVLSGIKSEELATIQYRVVNEQTLVGVGKID
jgi:hypothetical protein